MMSSCLQGVGYFVPCACVWLGGGTDFPALPVLTGVELRAPRLGHWVGVCHTMSRASDSDDVTPGSEPLVIQVGGCGSGLQSRCPYHQSRRTAWGGNQAFLGNVERVGCAWGSFSECSRVKVRGHTDLAMGLGCALCLVGGEREPAGPRPGQGHGVGDDDGDRRGQHAAHGADGEGVGGAEPGCHPGCMQRRSRGGRWSGQASRPGSSSWDLRTADVVVRGV